MAWTKAGREHEKEMEQMRLVAEAEKRKEDNAAKAVADKLYYENEEKNAMQRLEKKLKNGQVRNVLK